MYESRNKPLLHPTHFRRRLVLHVGYALLLIGVTLLVGTVGHKLFSSHDWHDAFMSAAFVIGGIGSYTIPESYGGKIFSVVYGFFVGLIVMATLGVILAPIAHRVMHKFHLDDMDD